MYACTFHLVSKNRAQTLQIRALDALERTGLQENHPRID